MIFKFAHPNFQPVGLFELCTFCEPIIMTTLDTELTTVWVSLLTQPTKRRQFWHLRPPEWRVNIRLGSNRCLSDTLRPAEWLSCEV